MVRSIHAGRDCDRSRCEIKGRNRTPKKCKHFLGKGRAREKVRVLYSVQNRTKKRCSDARPQCSKKSRKKRKPDDFLVKHKGENPTPLSQNRQMSFRYLSILLFHSSLFTITYYLKKCSLKLHFFIFSLSYRRDR